MRTNRIRLSPPRRSRYERALLLEAFDSNWIAPLGPHVDALEKEFAALLGVEEAVALSSGAAALHLALVVLGVGSGDEVLVSTLTRVAAANAVAYTGATATFIDSDRATWNMDPDLLADELRASAQRNKLPKAVIVVDVYGQCADYGPIRKVCARYEAPIVEDAAESIGVSYDGRPAGTFGALGAFSFGGVEGTADDGGGMFVCNRRQIARRVRFLASGANDQAPCDQLSEVGYDYCPSNLLAAVGRGQLWGLEERVERQRERFEFYRRALADVPGIAFMPEPPRCRSTRRLTCLTVAPRAFGAASEDVRLAMEAENIEAAPIWKPMHLQPVFSNCRVRGGDAAKLLFQQGLCLPGGSNLVEEDQLRVVNVLRAVGGCRPITLDIQPPARKTA